MKFVYVEYQMLIFKQIVAKGLNQDETTKNGDKFIFSWNTSFNSARH